jgi:protocatechuate 3,4-dioxygenase beta subunit
MRAAHLHFMVTADGYRRLVTHIFVRGGEHLHTDTVFGVRESLIKEFVQHDGAQPTPDGRDLGGRGWASARFDVVLAPASDDS